MDLATIAWISMGWLLVSIVVSLAVGRMFQHAGTTDAELEQTAERQRVVRYLRSRKPHAPKAAKSHTRSTASHG